MPPAPQQPDPDDEHPRARTSADDAPTDGTPDLKGTDLKGTDLKGTDVKGTDARGSDARGSDRKGTHAKRAEARERIAAGAAARWVDAALAPAPSGSSEDAARACRVLSRALAPRCFGANSRSPAGLLPGSPWRDADLVAPLVWLHLLEHGPSERRPELIVALDRARDRRATSRVGRALAASLANGPWRYEWLSNAVAAARATERGGTFASRRELAERAAAWTGGAARALAAQRRGRPTGLERVRARVAEFTAALQVRGAAAGGAETNFPAPDAVAASAADPRRLGAVAARLEPRLEAGLVAERLARWTADPVGELARGRLVVPADELARARLTAVDLVERPDDERWAPVFASQVGFVRGYCAKAWPSVNELGLMRGRVVAAWLTGVERCLDRIERTGFRTPTRPVAPPVAAWSGLARVSEPPDYRGLG